MAVMAHGEKEIAEEASVTPFRVLRKQVAFIEELHAALARENALLREQLCPSEREEIAGLNGLKAVLPMEDHPANERRPTDEKPSHIPRNFVNPRMEVNLTSAVEQQSVPDGTKSQTSSIESSSSIADNTSPVGVRSVWDNESNRSGEPRDKGFQKAVASLPPLEMPLRPSLHSCYSSDLEGHACTDSILGTTDSMVPANSVPSSTNSIQITFSGAPPLNEQQKKLLSELDVMRETVASDRTSATRQTTGRKGRGSVIGNIFRSGSSENIGKAISNGHAGSQSVSVCDVWKEAESKREFASEQPTHISRLQRQDSKALTGEALTGTSIWQSMIMRPNSRKRLVWDVLSICVIFYDVYSIPMEAFDPPQNSATLALDWITTGVWTVDIPVTFFSGFYTDWVVELRPIRIASHYLRTWFALDTTIITIDWCLLCVTMSSQMGAIGMMRMSKTVRFVRILRAVRLLRVVKLTGAFAEVVEHMRSETLRVLINICKLVVFVVIMNHYIACGWYALARFNNKEANWIKFDNLAGASIGYRYTTALHWSLTQFTPAAMEIYPHNLLERIYAILVLLFALVTFSSFVSSITGAMMRFQKISSEPAKQHAILRRYFVDNRISVELGNRIWKFLQNKHYAHKKRMHEKDIPILKLLPQTLKMALHEELYSPIVSAHPFFETYGMVNRTGSREVCNFCLTEHSVNAAQEVFAPGEPGEVGNTTMIFITSGVLNYIYTEDMSPKMINVESCGWLCEATLWMSWIHRGTLVANTSCELAIIDASKFHTIMSRQKVAAESPKKYAQTFVSLAQRPLEKLLHINRPR